MQVSSHKLPTATAQAIRCFTCVCNQLATHDPLFSGAIVCALSVKKDLSLRYFLTSFRLRVTELQARDFLHDSYLLFKMKQEQCQCFSQTVEVITPSSQISDHRQSSLAHSVIKLYQESTSFSKIYEEGNLGREHAFLSRETPCPGHSAGKAGIQVQVSGLWGCSRGPVPMSLRSQGSVQILRLHNPAASGVSKNSLWKAQAQDRRLTDL